MKKFNRAIDFALIYFFIAGSIFFLYYIYRFNKPIYLLFGILIYILSLLTRNILVKTRTKSGFSEGGMFLISMAFLAYTLYILRLDPEIVSYLPDKLIINSGAVFIFLLLVHLLPREKSGKPNLWLMLAALGIIIFREKFDLVFKIFPWAVPLLVGTPYIYLISVLAGIQKTGKAPEN